MKQLKSTKCFKYIKCSISDNSEEMLARLDREAGCDNSLLSGWVRLKTNEFVLTAAKMC